MKANLLWGLVPLVALTSEAVAQTRTVTGRVQDRSTNTALPGATVLVKGTTNGTSTGADGSFTLTVPAEGGTLVISSVGYVTVERPIGTENNFTVPLSSDTQQLNEVVVTALGIEQQKRGLGYAVAEVKAEELVQARATNVVNSLTGKVAGVRVQGASGMVGASSNIFIRGFTTFTGSNQPLFVIDGIPIDNGGGANNLQNGVSNSNRAIDINQDDIESVSVLKGPAAAVLYGSRASSGAIIITTKKGSSKSGQPALSFTSNYNIVTIGRTPDYQNTYGQGNRGAFSVLSQGSWGPRAEGQNITNFRGEQEAFTINPDNVTDIFKRGSNFQNNVSLSGGTDRSTYFASYGNLHEVGILENNDLKRNTLTFNGTTSLTEKLRTGVNFIYSNNRSQRTPQGNQLANPFFRTWFLPRTYDVSRYPFELPNGGQRSPTSATDLTPNNTWYSNDDNPLWTIKNNTYKDEINRIVGNASVGYDFADWISAEYRIGTDAYSQEYRQVSPRDSRGTPIGNFTPGPTPGVPGGTDIPVPTSGIGSTLDGIFSRREISSYLNLTFRRNLNENIGLRLLLGNEINQRRTSDVGAVGSDLNIRGFNNVASTLVYTPFSVTTEQRLLGVYADFQLDYRNFLFLNVTGRNDWSSTFLTENNSYFYPGASASFVFTDAFEGLRGNGVLSSGKIRAAAAQVGREAPIYRTSTNYRILGPSDGFGPNIAYPLFGNLGLTFDDIAGNADLGPEFTTTYETGLDLQFFNGRIGLEGSVFSQRSRDIIFQVPVAAASGSTQAFRNIGRMESRGIELLINATPVKAGDFTYTTSLNWTLIRNKVLELAPGVEQITLGGFVSPSTRLIAGQPYGVIFGSVFNRDPEGRLLLTSAGRPTLALDNQIVGDPNPKWTGGLTNTFSWKGLSLTGLIDFRYGGDIISRNVSDLRRQGAAKETENRDRTYIHDGVIRNADGTFSPNNIQITAEEYFDDLYGFGKAEFVVFDASWLRLRELALSYDLPRAFLEKTKAVRSVRLGLNARNVFLYAPNVPHIDPEVNAQGQSNSQGLEFNALPQSRMFGGSLTVSF